MPERNMKYDIVYPLKESEPNHDLRYSLRSLEKYGGEYGTVFVIGHCPKWLKNVVHIPIEQCSDKHISVRQNIRKICDCDFISEEFILFNDDFILTKPVEDWDVFCNRHSGTLKSKADLIKTMDCKKTPWLNGFEFNDKLLKSMGVKHPLNFEFHAPMIINRYKRKGMIYKKAFEPYLHKSNPLLFQRSLYGNLYGRTDGTFIEDRKLFTDLESVTETEYLTEYGFFSVSDNLIGNKEIANLNYWLNLTFPDKSSFEKLIE